VTLAKAIVARGTQLRFSVLLKIARFRGTGLRNDRKGHVVERLCAAAVVGALVLAQSTNPLIGTWELNVDKSKGSFKSGTTVIEAAGKDGVSSLSIW
jgi:hypothetical protein